MPCRPERPRGSHAAEAAERGFTLVEVMAATAVLGILVLCLANLWEVMDRMSFDLLLRQKAVLVLNGEMERLAWLYDTTGFGAGTITQSTGYTALTNVTGSTTRSVYATNSTGISAVSNSAATLQTMDSAVWVYGSGTSSQNFVWLDSSRNLLARVSWITCAVSAKTAQNCWGVSGNGPGPPAGSTYICEAFSGSGNGTCMLLTLVLDYPWQLSGNTPVAMAHQSTLTLNTIVGRRR
ncbi:MAG: prepilin-type N-terminal cleavage/methylation domain-containing protein [Acidisphaera sp.]|nr:prepilin-type N-terminal cleavage/methylation domain-containing protein [Acidisphaera sp.]